MSTELEPRSSTAVPNAWRAFRGRIAASPALNLAYRISVGIVGTVVLAVGVLAIPYPGPGWAIVFAGLGILATEFSAARQVLRWVRDRYKRVMAWYMAQGSFVQVLAAVFTCALVVATLWLLGTFGLVGGWFGLEWQWLRSPLMS